MVKFSQTGHNFGYDFVLLVHFFGTPCTISRIFITLGGLVTNLTHCLVVVGFVIGFADARPQLG